MLNGFGLFFSAFAKEAKTGSGTLKRIREGNAVSNETIFGVVDALINLVNDRVSVVNSSVVNILRQPLIEVGFYDGYGRWHHISRSDISIIYSKLEFVNAMRYGPDWREKSAGFYWNSKPTTLSWAFDFYRKNPRTSSALTDEMIRNLEAGLEVRMDERPLPLFE